ncbi:MAG: GNAT family N-acetyltransferase [Candidatus Dormibacteraeota bacterium]|nr:GNAT family N-acetyltransferase [Candidatus Dormibacteraeota bacterium]
MIKTARLLLRVPVPDDIDGLTAVFSDHEAMRYIGEGAIKSRAEVARQIEDERAYFDEHGFTMFTVVRKADREVLGDCGLWTWKETGETEIGWHLARKFWGQRFGSEAAVAVLDFANQAGLDQLICMVQTENVASLHIAERLGFQFDGEWLRRGRLTRRYRRQREKAAGHLP